MKQKISKFKITVYTFATISSLVLMFLFATHEVTRLDQIPAKYIVLSFSVLISLMIIAFLQKPNFKFILTSQVYFLLCIIVLFLMIEKNFDNTHFVLLRVILILIIAFPIYPFVPIILLIESTLQHIEITNEFLMYLIWIVLLDFLFLISIGSGNLHQKYIVKENI